RLGGRRPRPPHPPWLRTQRRHFERACRLHRRRIRHRRSSRSRPLHRHLHHRGAHLTLTSSMNVDDQPVRIRQQKRRVFRHVVHIQHHPRHVVGELSRTNLLKEPIVGDGKTFSDQLLRQPRPM